MITTPNTRIIPGKLKISDLEKFIEAYKEIGLNVTAGLPSIDSINESNKKLRELEITPNPFGEADNKLYVGVKADRDGKNLYVHTKILPNERNQLELVDQYDKLIRSYKLE